MKNILSLVTANEIDDFVLDRWKSDIFKDSHRKGGFVWNHVERFSRLPRLFAETSNDRIERAHFSTWWNVIMIRDYDNPIIHDLYYLHEMAHAATMPYVHNIGRAAFAEKMQRNELEASTLSEIQVYFEIPKLRSLSFDHEIYADRLLNDPYMIALWKANPVVAIEVIRTMRRDIMVSKAEHLMDSTEVWIRRFAEQNSAYDIIWSDRYREIENKMFELQYAATFDRRAALGDYRYWLEGEAAKDPVDFIPFRQEAELFSQFYWANKVKHEAAVKRQDAALA